MSNLNERGPQGGVLSNPAHDFLTRVDGKYRTILADPPWQFDNRTGKMAPEHKRLLRYPTMKLQEIKGLPVSMVADETAHLYLWVPNALLESGLEVMKSWGFEYKTNIIWHKIRKDGGSDGRGVGFYFRNVTEMLLFGVRGKGNRRTLAPGRSQVNYLATRKREHSRKPDEVFDIVESCSPSPYLELFARFPRVGWTTWGNEDVAENQFAGVALRKGHIQPSLRLVEAPRGYRGELTKPAPKKEERFEDIAVRRIASR